MDDPDIPSQGSLVEEDHLALQEAGDLLHILDQEEDISVLYCLVTASSMLGLDLPVLELLGRGLLEDKAHLCEEEEGDQGILDSIQDTGHGQGSHHCSREVDQSWSHLAEWGHWDQVQAPVQDCQPLTFSVLDSELH